MREAQLKTKKGQRTFQADHRTRSANDVALWRREQENLIYTHYSVENKAMGKATKRTLRKRIPELFDIAVAHGYTGSECTFRKNKPHQTDEPTNNIEKLTICYLETFNIMFFFSDCFESSLIKTRVSITINFFSSLIT